MVLDVSGNLKQFWKRIRQMQRALELFRKFSVAFRGLWHIQIGPRDL